MTNSINKHLRLKIPYTHNTNFNLKQLLTAFPKPNQSQNLIVMIQNCTKSFEYEISLYQDALCARYFVLEKTKLHF